jgi:mannitol 2-dehydrogenase
MDAAQNQNLSCETISRLVSPAVKLITLTVTEGGYYFDLSAKRLLAEHADIQNDLRGTTPPRTALGLLARVLDERRARGIELPTLLSCDNVSGNGHVLRAALLEFCQMSNPELAAYIEEHASFPNSMVDRITPRTTDADREHIRNTYWIDDQAPVVCERFFQWVIEDRFPLGRPAFENVPGVIFTSDVRPYEEMKLGLLNAGHSQLGYLGHLAGYTSIDQVAAEPTFGQLLTSFWHGEVIPHLAPVPGVSFDDYCATLTERFCNPSLGDQTLRICLDGSSNIPTFILPSVRAGLAHGTSIQLGALCVAAWIRFCSGTGERGEAIPLEDPMAQKLRELSIKVIDSPNHHAESFISGLPEVFGELSSSQTFIQTVSSWVHSLYVHGAPKTLLSALSIT